MTFFYFFVLISALLFIFGLYAQIKHQSALAKADRKNTIKGLTGSQAAQEVALSTLGAKHHEIIVKAGSGFFLDHFNPQSKELLLSDTGQKPTIAAFAVAAHEAGHIQQTTIDNSFTQKIVQMLRPATSTVFYFWLWPAILAWAFGLQPIAIGCMTIFILCALAQILSLQKEKEASLIAYEQLQEKYVDPAEQPLMQQAFEGAAYHGTASIASLLEPIIKWYYKNVQDTPTKPTKPTEEETTASYEDYKRYKAEKEAAKKQKETEQENLKNTVTGKTEATSKESIHAGVEYINQETIEETLHHYDKKEQENQPQTKPKTDHVSEFEKALKYAQYTEAPDVEKTLEHVKKTGSYIQTETETNKQENPQTQKLDIDKTLNNITRSSSSSYATENDEGEILLNFEDNTTTKQTPLDKLYSKNKTQTDNKIQPYTDDNTDLPNKTPPHEISSAEPPFHETTQEQNNKETEFSSENTQPQKSELDKLKDSIASLSDTLKKETEEHNQTNNEKP